MGNEWALTRWVFTQNPPRCFMLRYDLIVDRAWRLATLILASLSFAGTAAGAQETGRFRYAWARDEGAERCPDGPSIAREVARRLGRDPFVTVSGAPSIESMVRREGSSWVARLVVRDASGGLVGTREFTSTSADCTAIASAVTLGVALSIDPEAALRPPPAEALPPARQAVTPPEVLLLSRGVIPWWRRPVVSARVSVVAGLLPGAGVGVTLGVEGGPLRLLRLGAGMSFFPESATASGAFAFGLTTGWVAACLEPWSGARAAMGFCARVDAGALQAVVRQGIPVGAGQRAWGAATVSARLRVHLAGPVAAELGLEAMAPFARHRFFVGGNTVFQEGAGGSFVALGGFFGLALQFR